MTDPVTLSGGDLGGLTIEGEGWATGETREIDGHLYRRDGSAAVFVGLA